MTAYAPDENRYAEPFANLLAENASFRDWVLAKTAFAEHGMTARLLNDLMRAKRSKTARTWWGSHFTESCRCEGCRGHETDLLAIFEVPDGERFALHIEVKHPGDKFHPNQALAYQARAKCWSTEGRMPKMVVPHARAATVALCSQSKLRAFEQDLALFDAVFTWEEILKAFPNEFVVGPRSS